MFDVKFSQQQQQQQQQRQKYQSNNEDKLNQQRPSFARRRNNQHRTKLNITNKHNHFNLNQTPLQAALPVDNQRFANEDEYVEENGCNYFEEIDYGGGRGDDENEDDGNDVQNLDTLANKCQQMIISIENPFNGHLMKNTNESTSNTNTMR